ncbi:arsenite efflux transporter metallochaperone ArsD [Bifidobacterium cuniculi]|uniref:Arsenical resistance operon trans-acting repressor n=1 Tax=Bifidobacterium cuniculi TaxID=1688 RepID=A0A087B4K8_9BIFI|nr:arsenite efflux transporter metallochaperone ArsD [Bifidobacterium cuniculi]KFI65958.1 arsenical resistance operon trans-acting repressor [Bifidobacterium cuniculi]
MSRIHIYDPSLCCSSGVCGEEVDPALVDARAMIAAAQEEGIEITRHNPSTAPLDFAQEPAIAKLLETKGTQALPAVVVDGTLVQYGSYPTISQVRAWNRDGADANATETPAASRQCRCGGASCC